MISERLRQLLLLLPRDVKRMIAVCVDAGLCALSLWLALCLRLSTWVALDGSHLFGIGISLIYALPIFISGGMYRAIFRYAGMQAFLAVLRSLGLYSVLFLLTVAAVGIPGIPRTVGLIQPLILTVFVGLLRLFIRAWLGGSYQAMLAAGRRKPVLVYGAGNAGRHLAAALAGSTEVAVVGYLDDNPDLQRSLLNGLPVHSPASLGVLTGSGIRDVLLALPSVTRHRRKEILEAMRRYRVNVREMPDVTDIAQGRVTVSDLKELNIDDLLGRASVDPDPVLLAASITGRTVMITGAGGSIGAELCRQVVSQRPEKILLIEQNEFALYTIHRELLRLAQTRDLPVEVLPFLASVRDEARVRDILLRHRPATVYHAAAYKHVPIVEMNSAEGVRNNVGATLRFAQLAREAMVECFVLISTDKAVRPTNVMGASKRLAEMALQALDAEQRRRGGGTRFSMVRFGNVLGSSGSVVPLFRQQIRDGGPLTLTHPDITRYFMSIPEASQLVIQAGAMATGGDVFVLDMGEPVKIADLARRMVELSGRSIRDEANPDGDIEIAITGLRPGEKLYEELLIGDNPVATGHPRILRAQEDFLPIDVFRDRLDRLKAALDIGDFGIARDLLRETVNGYQPTDDIADLLAGDTT